MPTQVILYIFTFLFIFLWPFGVNILESVCLLLSNLVLYFWDELYISKKVREIQSTRIHYENNNIYSSPFSRSVGVSPTPRISPTSSVARFCVVLWIFHTKNSIFLFQGLASQVDKFVEEEVEVRQIPHLSDGDLRSLGFVTISSRQRLRSAAAAWVPQVICLCSFDCHVLKKKFSTNTTICSCVSSREKWYECDARKYLLVFLK